MALGDVANVPHPTAVPTSPTYCTVDDVSRYLQKPIPAKNTDEGIPGRTDWENTIIDIEDVVDDTTKSSWRERRVETEYHDIEGFMQEDYWYLVKLRNTPVRELSAGDGDALEVRAGGSWEDWLATRTQGIAGEFWVQEDLGYLRIKRGYWHLNRDAAVRISYRYGHTAVPQNIRRATAMLAAADLLTGGMEGQQGSGGDSDRLGMSQRIERLETRAYVILARYQGVE